MGINFKNCWNISGEAFMHHLDELAKNDDLGKFFSDIECNPSKQVILYYLNSGYRRFGAHKEFDKKHILERM